MNQPASISTSLTAQPAQSAQADRPLMLWAVVAVATVIACVVLVIDSSLTADQRIALFMQSGMFP